jgi:hypothetical protein
MNRQFRLLWLALFGSVVLGGCVTVEHEHPAPPPERQTIVVPESQPDSSVKVIVPPDRR